MYIAFYISLTLWVEPVEISFSQDTFHFGCKRNEVNEEEEFFFNFTLF